MKSCSYLKQNEFQRLSEYRRQLRGRKEEKDFLLLPFYTFWQIIPCLMNFFSRCSEKSRSYQLLVIKKFPILDTFCSFYLLFSSTHYCVRIVEKNFCTKYSYIVHPIVDEAYQNDFNNAVVRISALGSQYVSM